MVIKAATPLTHPSAWAELYFQNILSATPEDRQKQLRKELNCLLKSFLDIWTNWFEHFVFLFKWFPTRHYPRYYQQHMTKSTLPLGYCTRIWLFSKTNKKNNLATRTIIPSKTRIIRKFMKSMHHKHTAIFYVYMK